MTSSNITQNTNEATRKKGSILIHPLGFEPFGQGVGEKLA